jgi:hypothetical protein
MIERYTPHHYNMVNNWFKERKGDNIPEAFIPATGFVVPEIAAGFLIKTDCNVCFLEPFIANPNASSEVRDKAIVSILNNLEKEAIKLGFKYVYGISTAPTMIQRAEDNGWVNIGSNYTTLAKELK